MLAAALCPDAVLWRRGRGEVPMLYMQNPLLVASSVMAPAFLSQSRGFSFTYVFSKVSWEGVPFTCDVHTATAKDLPARRILVVAVITTLPISRSRTRRGPVQISFRSPLEPSSGLLDKNCALVS